MEGKTKNFTIKWFWLYRAFSYDFIFYYTIATLYYTTTKAFALADVMLLHSITAISTFALLLPISWIIKKIGNTLSIRVGTFLWILYMVGTIFINNFYAILALEILCSIGTILKILSDSVIIVNTLEKHNMQDKYVKIESRGVTTYFMADCVAALLAGFLFNINPHLPMIMCLIAIIMSFILSLKIKDETENYKGVKLISKHYEAENITEKFNLKAFLKNKTILRFLFFVTAFYGFVMSIGYMQTIGLVSLGLNAVYISLTLVVCKFVNALSAFLYGKFQNKIKKKFPLFMPIYLIGLTLIVGLSYTFLPVGLFKTLFICAFLILIEFVKQPYRLFAKDYIKSNSSGKKRQNFYTIYFMCETAGDFLLCLLGSILLEQFSVGYTYLIILSIAIIPVIITSILLYRLSKSKESSFSADNKKI